MIVSDGVVHHITGPEEAGDDGSDEGGWTSQEEEEEDTSLSSHNYTDLSYQEIQVRSWEWAIEEDGVGWGFFLECANE